MKLQSMAMVGLDCGAIGGIPSNAAAAFGSIAMNGDEYVRCNRCGYGGCDVRVVGCGCTLHARCTRLTPNTPISCCPQCSRPTTGLVLFPMSFREIDEARKTVAALANNGKRGRKRKNSSLSQPGVSGQGRASIDDEKGLSQDRRTGRWTPEEMGFCDKLIEMFKEGHLPLVEGVKLNDFLANMLKSKQSRLTKKMKNAKLSAKAFKRTTGHIPDIAQTRDFSELEDAFFHSIQCQLERAEIKFHIQKEWREQFSSFCVSIGQPLEADSWLSSVEEMDRRASLAKDAARMARRKLMMGYALIQDSKNPDQGVFIEKTEAEKLVEKETAARAIIPGAVPSASGIINQRPPNKETEEMLSLLADRSIFNESGVPRDIDGVDANGHSSLLHSAPFLGKVVNYMQRHSVPFEHVDVWVPSFVPAGGSPNDAQAEAENKCRLCYAGCGTTESQVSPEGRGPSVVLTPEERFNLLAFGDYSQKFSFDVGCGLPGRVYQSGVPTWEQSVHNAPHHHFERCGGAVQWGIKTVVGIPIPSPNVGRIVVTMYSRHDRSKDQELVGRLCEELTKLMPSPKWKLVVDVGTPPPAPPSNGDKADAAAAANDEKDKGDDRINEIVSLLGEHMPSNPSDPLGSFLPGFMSLRLTLLRSSRSNEEEELVRTMVGSYTSYSAGDRTKSDIAVMLARDFMFLTQQQQQQQSQQKHQSFGMGKAPSAVTSSSGSLASGFSFYGIPALDGGIQTSPALTPIPPSSSLTDTLSIVST